MANKPTKVAIDFNKLRDQVNREIKKRGGEAISKFPQADKEKIGQDIITLMREQIAKGISPIEGWGRFPAYKAVSRFTRANKSIKNKFKGNTIRAKSSRRELKTAAKSERNRGYPFSVMNQYPDKKTSPVNLSLSGTFLWKLKSIAIPGGIAIGFFDEKSIKMEDGHRTGGVKGMNDQPQRPIIPIEGETFTRNIMNRAIDIVRNRFLSRYGGK